MSAFVIVLLLTVFLHPLNNKNNLVKKSQVKAELSMLITAAKAYQVEYGVPLEGDSIAQIQTLQGNNPRKLLFIEINPKEMSKEGLFFDPWGTPYVLNLTNPSNLWAYSFGKNKIDEGGNGDDVASWK